MLELAQLDPTLGGKTPWSIELLEDMA